MAEFVQYTRPPVRNTALRVYFEPIEEFDIALSMSLAAQWREDYSAIRQSFVKPRPTGSNLPEVALPFADGNWYAMSSIEQADESLQRVLAYQFDQIALSWTFDAEKPEGQYPGFEHLSAEFNKRLDKFSAVLNEADSEFRVQGCECVYTNLLEDVRGPQWVNGYVTSWSNPDANVNLPTGTEFLGFNIRNETSNEVGNTVSRVRLNDELESREAELTIRVVATPHDDAAEGVDQISLASKLMNLAHGELIRNFELCADPEMKEKWGKVKR
ncbi:hypothetical protein [Gordonia malaquae]|uniref:hypothetical protein n=1 Tax=Gordonia malaquae TaxID=410332 RepID=UPI0030FE449D